MSDHLIFRAQVMGALGLEPTDTLEAALVKITALQNATPAPDPQRHSTGEWCPFCKSYHDNPSVQRDRGGYTHLCRAAQKTCTCDCPKFFAAGIQNHDPDCKLRFA